MIGLAEYIWLDGTSPTQELRSKSKVIEYGKEVTLDAFTEWGFDGSSTNQAEGGNSDCILNPVSFVKDPIRGEGNYLVMCEVMNVDGTPHSTNSRAKLQKILEAGGASHDPWVGFEQEYTLFEGTHPLEWPAEGYPGPQGPYYCGVGASRVSGRALVEDHTKACIDAGIMIYGINAEVMPAQWEFQIGYRGIKSESADPLTVSDHLWMARWLLARIGENYGINASLSPKPIKGDWNGAGKHTNFSTKETRDPKLGKNAIADAITKLEGKHSDHIRLYGAGLEERLTGLHETCHITEFRAGTSDRGASIRIPAGVAEKGYGYIEDRRPAANADPYVVSARLVATVCGITEGDSAFRKVA